MKKLFIFAVPFYVLSTSDVYAQYTGPELLMPLPGGESWNVNVIPGGYFTHTGEDFYSIDFDDDKESDGVGNDLGQGVVDVLASAQGIASVYYDQYGYGLYVVVDHGGGYDTLYAHCYPNSVEVLNGEFVYRGQVLCKLGNTGNSNGAHLHFQVLYNGDSSSWNPALDGVRVNGVQFLSFQEYNFYSSSNFAATINPFNLNSNYPIACGDYPIGTGSPNWDYLCYNQRDTFQKGETAYVMVKIEDIPSYMNHHFEAGIYKDGDELWTSQISGTNVVGAGGWEDAYSWVTINNLTPGEYTVSFFVDTDNGYYYAGSKEFLVSGQLYEYYDSLTTCKCGINGGQNTNWFYTCRVNSSGNIFYPGETAYGLVRLHNVYSDHKYRIFVYRNGNYQWEWELPFWNEVSPWGWQYSHFWYQIPNIGLGNWEFRIYLEMNDGYGFRYLDSIPFWVSYSAYPVNCN